MIRIYHTSDLHNHGQIAEKLSALRAAEPGLLVDCGDSLRGSQTVFFGREPIVAEIDAANYDLQAMGNREFHYLFGAVEARVRLMRHPLLCANLVDTKGRALPFIAEKTVRYDDGIRPRDVRFFGLLVPQYPVGSFWEKIFGWRFLDPFVVAEQIAASTPDDVTLVALSHIGLRADRELARRVPRIDLLLGGHSHDTLPQPEFVGDVPIVHAGPYGRFVSRTELTLTPERARITRFDLIPLLEAAHA
jgi:2',3'-cyclic-nucleotide 2'-phosphodiesterase (5'-nucleotidase family)